MELMLSCSDLPPEGRFSLIVRASAAALSASGGGGGGGGGVVEQTVITVDTTAGTLSVDTTLSRALWSPPAVTDPDAPKTDPDEMRLLFPVMGQVPPPIETPNQVAPFSLETGEALSLRVLIDKSVLEVYANGRQCVTARMYPSDPGGSIGVGLLSQQGSTVVTELQAFQLRTTACTS